MKKSFILALFKKTPNYLVYSCPSINGMYVRKAILPKPVPKAVKVTIDVEEVLQGIE